LLVNCLAFFLTTNEFNLNQLIIKQLILPIFIFSISLISAQSTKNRVSKSSPIFKPAFESLKGKVKSIHLTTFNATDILGELSKKDVKNYFVGLYDTLGNKKEETHYNGSGNISEKYKFKYDSKNKLESESRFNANGKLYGKLVYKYDKNNFIIEITDYSADSLVEGKTTYTNDENGNIAEELDYNSDGILFDKSQKSQIESSSPNFQKNIFFKG